MKYYLIAGEASGDLHASHLMAALKKEDPQADFRFFGGDLMAAVGGFLNAYLLLPAYAAAFGMPIDSLVGMGSAVNAAITSLPTFCLFAVVPFNLVKGVVVSVITLLLYKHISRILKGEAMG